MPSRLSTWWRGAKQAGARALCAAMLSAVALCCAGATSAGAAAVAPEPNADPTIVVQGNRRIDADAIRAYFHGMHAAPGAGFTPAALDAALKELYATGLFDDVRIVPAGGRVVVTVVEAPVIVRRAVRGQQADQGQGHRQGDRPEAARRDDQGGGAERGRRASSRSTIRSAATT